MTPLPRGAGAAAAGFVFVGALAAGFLDATPAWVRIVLSLAGLIVAPALVFAPRLRGVVTAGGLLGGVLPVSLVGVLSLHACVATIFALSGVPFSAYATTVIWGTLAGFAGVLAARLRRPERPLPGVSGLRLHRMIPPLLLLVGLAAVLAPRYTGAEDAFDHMGYVRRVITLDTMRPDGVLSLPVEAVDALPPDPRKGGFHDLVALVADLAGADAVPVWWMLRLLMYPLGVLAFAGFASLFTRGVALALCMGLFLLSYAGNAVRFADAAAYGQGLAATWYWTLAVLVLGGGGAGRARKAMVLLLAGGGVLAHLGVAMHATVLALTLLVFGGMLGIARANARRDALWMLAGVAAAFALRTAGAWGAGAGNEIHTHVHGIMTVTGRWFVMSPMEILRQHGLLFLGGITLLPFTAVAARTDARARAVVALSLIPVCIAFVPPLATLSYQYAGYMAFRVLLNAPLLPAIVVTVAWMIRGARRRGPALRVASAIVLVLWGIVFMGPSLRAGAGELGRRSAAGTAAPRPLDLDTLVAGLPVGATVLSDPVTSYRLSAFTSHRFVAVLHQHANPRDPWALDRLAAVRDVISPFALPQSAVEACRRYRVDFVVLSGRAWGIGPGYLTPGRPDTFDAAWLRLASMPDSFREFARGDDFVVLRFDPDARESNDFDGVRAPVETGGGPPATCRIAVPNDRFEVTGFGVAPAVVSAGDSLMVTFGYRRDRVSALRPDVIFHVRFDHESLAGAARVPGDKYVRRMRERWLHVRYRFRSDLVAGHGIYEPDLWPVGTPLTEEFRIAVPSGAAPGRYRVEVTAVETTLLPNFDVTDLLFNRDHYSGVACATIEVRPGVAR
ncbi:MAG: hypothetical protein OEX18_03860 [Candidatus Krumholzibacteria bacterium]|nr:hypothetical protein [Candidatus Krumholzibacteria bacterium]MDH4336397.1 hypothetical protein [Candidatus Krumholzibacteria bacterium]MDH5269522.1 hypothetical protein [Candidatus Krumholzibacteria bacterium]